MTRLMVELWCAAAIFVAITLSGIVWSVRAARRRDWAGRTNGCTLAFFGAFAGCCLAIVAPEFECAIVAAQKSSCFSNLKTIGGAMMQYAEDHDERLPGSGGLQSVAAYLPRGIYRCPAAKSPCSYAMNKHVVRLSLDRIENVEKLVLVFEADAPSPRTLGDMLDLPKPARHSESDVYAFCDGHAKPLWRSYATDAAKKPIDWLPSLTKP